MKFNGNLKFNFFNWKKIFVRLVHLTLILFVTGNLFIKNTELHRALVKRDYIYVYGFVALTYASILFYFLTCFTDPGFVSINERFDGGESNLDDKSTNTEVRLRFCDYCNIEQPIRSRHCEECKRCVKKFDHHCPWLETCIGEKNHKYFWLFLATTDCLIVWCIVISWRAILAAPSWSIWIILNMLFILDLHVLIISLIVSFSLLCIHTYFMFTNTTTWEKFSRRNITYLRVIKNDNSNPFHESYMKNICLFLCYFKTIKWENVYLKYVNSKFNSKLNAFNGTSKEYDLNEMKIIDKNNEQTTESSSD